MKLFHWPAVQALTDYSSGDVIVMANTIEEARAIVRKDNPSSRDPEDYPDRKDNIADEIDCTEPGVSDVPAGIYIRGSS